MLMYLSERLGINPALVPVFLALQREKKIINPLLHGSVDRLAGLADLDDQKTALDLACGRGGVSIPIIKKYGASLIGVDLIPEFIEGAGTYAQEAGVGERCDFINMEVIEFLESESRKYDLVLMLGASFIWGGLINALEALPKLVKPGGILMIGEPYRIPDIPDADSEIFDQKEGVTERLKKIGTILDVIDDGMPGWQSYYEPENKAKSMLRSNNPEFDGVMDFLDEQDKIQEWEIENLGWAVWVIKIN